MRFIIDDAGVLDTPLKLLTIESLKIMKSYNCKTMSATNKAIEPIFFWLILIWLLSGF